MKNLSWFNKIIFLFNILLAILTLIGYLLPFLAPKLFPFLAVLTLILPLMLILNCLFLIFWLLQFKKQFFLSAVVLLVGITFINKFYKFSGKDLVQEDTDFTVMSYNVRLFNLFEWMGKQNVPEDIKDFVESQSPDILCIQEFSTSANLKFTNYPYRYILMQGDNIRTGQAIFSKFPILHKGEIEFPKSDNNVIFADIKMKRDTIRVYSIHLQSTRISPDINDKLDEAKSKKIFKRMGEAFAEQQHQSDLIKEHTAKCNFPKIICGDMNNSAFSYVYRNIKGDMKDAFEEAGEGFGKTYDYEFYPARIDYILVDRTFEVKAFKNFDSFINSDHFPISTRLSLVKE